MQRVTVGILTYNRKNTLPRAIESVYEQQYPNVEIVVVDSNSSDGTSEMVRERFPGVVLIRLPRNLGCPGGRNHVHANATGDIIINLDDDAYLGDQALARLVETFDADPSIGIVSMGVRFIGKTYPADEDQGWEEVGTFRGTASAVRSSMIARIGDYPDHFFMMDEEEHLSIRALNAGYRIVHRRSSFIWHPLHDGSGSRRFDYYRFRNPLLVVAELFPGWLFVKYLVLRMASHTVHSARRSSLHQYLRGLLYVGCRLPGLLLRRQPCSKAAVTKYLKLRRLIAANYGLK